MIEISTQSDLQNFGAKAEKLLVDMAQEIQADFERKKVESRITQIGFRVPKLTVNAPKLTQRNSLKIG
jgi:hypothetical protein